MHYLTTDVFKHFTFFKCGQFFDLLVVTLLDMVQIALYFKVSSFTFLLISRHPCMKEFQFSKKRSACMMVFLSKNPNYHTFWQKLQVFCLKMGKIFRKHSLFNPFCVSFWACHIKYHQRMLRTHSTFCIVLLAVCLE